MEVVMKEKLKNLFYRNILFLLFVLSSLVNSFLLRAFTVKNYFSLKPVLADIVIVLVISVFGFLIKNPKRRFAYYMPWTCIFVVLCVANSIYYTNYRSFISISLISTATQLGGVMDAVTENILEVKDLVFIWAIPAMIVAYILLKKKEGYFEKVKETQKRTKSALTTLSTAGVCLVLFAINLTGTDLSRLAKQWNREYVVSRFGLYTYQITDTVSSIRAKLNILFGYKKNREIFDEFYEEKNKTEEAVSDTNEYTDIFKDKNVIVIHAESIQQFCIGTYFNGEPLTPNLNKLVDEGLYFSNYYAQESVGTSSDSEFTFSTSLMPASSGTVAINYWDRDYVSIQKCMKQLGYYVFSMHGNNGSYWNRMNFHSSLGYDRFFNYDSDFDIDETIGLGLSDKSFFRQSIEKIKEIAANGKFYGTMIMLTNHTPFTDIENHSDFKVTFDYMKLNEETGDYEYYSAPFMEGTKLGSYFKSVNYADAAIGQFIEDLDREGILDNTILVIYGDHDAKVKEQFYEQYYNYDPFTETIRTEDDEGYIPVDDFAYSINRRVPFIIWSKNGECEPKEITQVMGMYDALPTLGNMLGFKDEYALGHDVFSFKEDEENLVIFPNGDFVTDTIYYDSQMDSYFDLSNYENVAMHASCNQQFANKKPEEIFSDEYVGYKTAENETYNAENYETHKNNGAVDDNYISERSQIAEHEITVSNAIIYYDILRRIKEEGGSLDNIEESIQDMTKTTTSRATTTAPPQESVSAVTTAPQTSTEAPVGGTEPPASSGSSGSSSGSESTSKTEGTTVTSYAPDSAARTSTAA